MSTRPTIKASDVTGLSTTSTTTPSASVGVDYSSTYQLTSGIGTQDDGPAIQAVIDGMPAVGGTLRLPAGTLNVQTGVLLNKPITVIGHGGMDAYYRATPTCLATTLGIDVLTVTAPAVTLEKFGIWNKGATPTTGSGVKTNIDVAHPYDPQDYPHVGSSFSVRGVSVLGCFDGMLGVNFFESILSELRIHGFVNTGVTIGSAALPDGGDTTIQNSFIIADLSRSGGTSIQQNTSGGLKVLNVKMNSRGAGCTLGHGIVSNFSAINATEGKEASSILFADAGTSFENGTGYFLDANGLPMIHIGAGCEMARYNTSSLPFLRLQNCREGILGGFIARNQIGYSAGNMTTLAQFRNCDRWLIKRAVDYQFNGGGQAAYDIDSSNTNIKGYWNNYA